MKVYPLLSIIMLLITIPFNVIFAQDSDTEAKRLFLIQEGMKSKMQEQAQAADVNKDGNISSAEFLSEIQGSFAQMDTNRDGVITPGERESMNKAMQAEQKSMQEQAKNKSQQQQSITESPPTFQQIDLNRDGKIAPEERAAILKDMEARAKAKWQQEQQVQTKNTPTQPITTKKELFQ